MLPTLHDLYSPDFVVANGENSAAGLGITPDISRRLLDAGVDVITLGNHTWSKRDVVEYLDREPRLLRPANFPAGTPGKGCGVFCSRTGTARVGVANLMGRTFMQPLDDPFRMADTLLESFRRTNQDFAVRLSCRSNFRKDRFRELFGWPCQRCRRHPYTCADRR